MEMNTPRIINREEQASVEVLPATPLCPFTVGEAAQWQRIKLQRYRFQSGYLELDNPSEHCVVLQLGGPTLVDNRLGGIGRRERFWLGRGRMILTPAGSKVLLDLKGPSNIVLIRLGARLIAETAAAVYGLDPHGSALRPSLCVADEKLRASCELLLAEAENDTPGSGPMIESLGRAMALQLLRRHSTIAAPEPQKSPPLAGARLRRVLNFMYEHLDEALPIARLAKVGGLSPSHFIRAFRRATGQSPHRHLINLRAEKARELLEQTDLPVIDVSLQCGFEQPTHFATMFRSRMGMSPRDWRSAHRY
jgi:AraC family transcriptional regulator